MSVRANPGMNDTAVKALALVWRKAEALELIASQEESNEFAERTLTVKAMVALPLTLEFVEVMGLRRNADLAVPVQQHAHQRSARPRHSNDEDGWYFVCHVDK